LKSACRSTRSAGPPAASAPPVQPGDHLDADDNIITIETGKVALDIPCPWPGTVAGVFVEVGDKPNEGALLITLDRDH